MNTKEALASIEWEYATGVIDYEEYRQSILDLHAKKANHVPPKQQCVLEFNPEPGIKVRTTLARSGGMSR